MAAPKTWNVDWLWSNSERRYPLMDSVTGLDETGTFAIPNSFLLDLCVTYAASAVSVPGAFHVSSIASYSGGYVVTLAYNSGSAFGVFTVPAATHTWGSQYLITDAAGSGAVYGHVAVGDLKEINNQPAGIWSFALAGARLQPRCVVPIFTGPPGFRVRSGGVLSSLLQNVVVLEPGVNTQLRVDIDNNTVYIDAVGNSDFASDCLCPGSRVTGDPILTINGQAPNASGDFTLATADCMAWDPVANGIVLSDRCAEPCCGCSELTVINEALRAVRDQYTTLYSYASRLEQTAGQLSNAIAMSPLDGG